MNDWEWELAVTSKGCVSLFGRVFSPMCGSILIDYLLYWFFSQPYS